MQRLQIYLFIFFLLVLFTTACHAEGGSSLVGISKEELQNQKKDQQLLTHEELLQQEKVLTETALQTVCGIVQQLQEEHGPSQPLFEKLNKKLKKDIKKAKKDRKLAEKLVKDTQELQTAIQTVIGQLETNGAAIVIEKLHKTLQGLFFGVLNIPAVSNARMANGGLGGPINRDKLKELTKWYDGVIQRHFEQTTKYNTHVGQVITVVLVAEAKRLQIVVNTNLALFQNILAQYQRK